MKVLKNRSIYLSISAVFFVLSLFLIFVPKLNLGIDMTGGTQAEYGYTKSLNIEKIRETLTDESKEILSDGKEIINAVSVYKVSGEKKIAVVV
jgi:preprotein translocase subunit SecF